MKALLYGLLLSLLWMTGAQGAALVISINENNRYYRNTGTITLYDPFIEGKVLGNYKFVTGGAGRGSLPFGKYEVGSYRDDPGSSFTRDSPRFRRRWMIRHVGMGDGEARGKDGETWDYLELHSIHASGRTAGCLGVLGGLDVWDDFVSKMNTIVAAVGDISFEIAANPNGSAGETYVASRRHPRHGKVAWHRSKSHKHVKVAHHKPLRKYHKKAKRRLAKASRRRHIS